MRPKDLMIIEVEESRDPYNSGLFPVLDEDHVEFILDGEVVIGDTTTIVEDFWGDRS